MSSGEPVAMLMVNMFPTGSGTNPAGTMVTDELPGAILRIVATVSVIPALGPAIKLNF